MSFGRKEARGAEFLRAGDQAEGTVERRAGPARDLGFILKSDGNRCA